MQRNIKFTILAIAFMLSAKTGKTQVEPHFSQYYAYPLWLNAGMTGAFDGDYRVTAIHRRQWAGLMQPFSTYGISADVVTNKNINIGANLMNQSAGDAGYNYMNGYLSVAYTGVKFGTEGYQQISFGIQGGIINRRFDPTKFQFGDQWTALGGYNGSNPGGEALTQNSSSQLDFGAGVAYYDGSPDKKANLFLGLSAAHLTRPEDPFLVDNVVSRVPVRYTMHGGVRFSINDRVSFLPNVIFMQQGNAREIMAGAYVQMQANEELDLLGGVNYRLKDAVSPYLGLSYKNVTMGLSYDVNASSLGKATTGNANSFELSLTYISRKNKKNPKQYFKCPRL